MYNNIVMRPIAIWQNGALFNVEHAYSVVAGETLRRRAEDR